MRLADLRPGWRTDFILHRFDAELIERDDAIVVRTPSNPTFYWGNCLVLPCAPRDDELGHWLERFDAEIASRQPLSRHVAIGVDAPYRGEALPAWQAAGLQVVRHELLALAPGALREPARAPRGDVALHRLDAARDAARVIDVEATDSGPFEPAGYREYLQRQWRRYLPMQTAGQLQWFGLACDGTLAASCGLIRESAAPGSAARFQRVVTHAQWRRRGLASALVHAVARFAFEQWQASQVYIVADPDDVAIRIYRSLGLRDAGSGWGLQRNAPQDRGA